VAKIKIVIDHDLCNGSGLCVENCPGGGLAMKDGKAVVVYPERCGECYFCESICPTGAIRVYRVEEGS
jgi:NAD-dependent dihydropyrimidine dehydrogenase PreA subunit